MPGPDTLTYLRACSRGYESAYCALNAADKQLHLSLAQAFAARIMEIDRAAPSPSTGSSMTEDMYMQGRNRVGSTERVLR
jgi:hypothetical protein